MHNYTVICNLLTHKYNKFTFFLYSRYIISTTKSNISCLGRFSVAMEVPFLGLNFDHYHEIHPCNHFNHDFDCFQTSTLSKSSSLKTILNNAQFNTDIDERVGTEKTMLLSIALIEKIRLCDDCKDESIWIKDFVGRCLFIGFTCLLKLLNNFDISLFDFLPEKQQNNEIGSHFIQFAQQHGYSACLLMYYLFLWYQQAIIYIKMKHEFYNCEKNGNYCLYHHLIAISQVLYHNYDKWKNSKQNKYILNEYFINWNYNHLNKNKNESIYGTTIVQNMQCCKIHYRMGCGNSNLKARLRALGADLKQTEDATTREFKRLYPVSLDQLLDYMLDINYNDCQISRAIVYQIIIHSIYNYKLGIYYSFPTNILMYKTILYFWKKEKETKRNILIVTIAIATNLFFHHCIDWNMFFQNKNSNYNRRYSKLKHKNQSNNDILCDRINKMFRFDWLTDWLQDGIHQSRKSEGQYDCRMVNFSLWMFKGHISKVFVDLVILGQRWDIARIFAVECNNCVELKNSSFHVACKMIVNRSKKKRRRHQMIEEYKNEQRQKYTRALRLRSIENNSNVENDKRLNDKLTNFFTKCDGSIDGSAYFHWRNLVIGKRCQTCHFRNEKLRKCKHCKKAVYCSRKCQKIGWNLKNHKNLCVKWINSTRSP